MREETIVLALCHNCGQHFNSKRKTAKYCGNRCRQAALRKRQRDEENQRLLALGLAPVGRRRELVTVRTRQFEDAIAHCLAEEDLAGARALKGLADLVKAPLSDEYIEIKRGQYSLMRDE